MSSAIPGATTQLLTIAAAALPATAQVWFGVELGTYTAPVTLQIVSITGDQTPAELGPNYRREETFAYQCKLSSFAGDEDYASRLQEVMTQFAALEIAVANNYTLNGTVRFAQCCHFTYEPATDGAGKSLGLLSFDIECEARVTSLT